MGTIIVSQEKYPWRINGVLFLDELPEFKRSMLEAITYRNLDRAGWVD